MDLTDLVHGHGDYIKQMDAVLDRLGFAQPSQPTEESVELRLYTVYLRRKQTRRVKANSPCSGEISHDMFFVLVQMPFRALYSSCNNPMKKSVSSHSIG